MTNINRGLITHSQSHPLIAPATDFTFYLTLFVPTLLGLFVARAALAVCTPMHTHIHTHIERTSLDAIQGRPHRRADEGN